MRIQLLALGTMAIALAGEAALSVQLVQKDLGANLSYLEFSKFEAMRMFSSAGLQIEWCWSPKKCRDWDGRIIVTLQPAAPALSSQSALAEAQLFEGRNIRVFIDRINQLSGDNPGLRRRVLAHVFAHEIMHMLQGCDCHSSSGVMSAHWSLRDIAEMGFGPLPFDLANIELMRDGLVKRKKFLSAVTVFRNEQR